MRDEKAKLKELSNNISDRSEAKGTGIMSDLLLVNGEARQLVANPHYTILLRCADAPKPQIISAENRKSAVVCREAPVVSPIS